MQSLAVVYRPQTFESICSQNYIKAILNKQLETNNLKHCYLFAGASGCGRVSEPEFNFKGNNRYDLFYVT